MAYVYKRAETVQSGYVTGTLSNFPALFSRTHNDFRTVGNGGHVANANGYDLNLFADSGGAPGTMLDMETESYNAVTGQVIKHARVPSIATSTAVWWQYGDAAITTTQDNKNAVWDSDFLFVYHFGDGSTLNLTNSKSSSYGLTNSSATAAAGKVGGGVASTGPSQKLTMGTSVNYGGNASIHVSCWFKRANWSDGATYGTVFNTSDYTSNAGLNVSLGAANTALSWQTGDWLHIGQGYSINPQCVAPPGALSNASWHHFASTVTGGSHASMHLDGAPLTLRFGTSGSIAANGTLTFIGDSDCVLDEFRLSLVHRDAAWVAAEYGNTATPTSFWSLGSEIGAATKAPPIFLPLRPQFYRQRARIL